MIIAVSMRSVGGPSDAEPRDAISHDWIQCVSRLGAIPLLVPNGLPDPAGYAKAFGARGLLLTGGEDLGPLPGEAGAAAPLTPRDRTERALLESAVRGRLPVFGVCRGMQLINVSFGGSLSRNLAAESAGNGSHVGAHHEVAIVEPRAQALAGADRVVTNSYHAQGVTLSRLAPSLRAFALAHGEVVEGLRHAELPVIGIQWHPERDNPAAAFDQALLSGWLAQCA
jgi:putative glutamine amidotransferase